MVTISEALLYYKRKDVQRAIVEHAADKEISGCFNMKGFSKRPDILQYPNEVLEMVKRGITSFHCSEEIWKNPLQISSTVPKARLNEMRKGWDLLLDIDCPELELSKMAAHFLVEALEFHEIKSIYVKFSGNHGFHIAVPFEAFPIEVYGKETRTLFPEAPRRIAAYLQHMIEPHLRKAMLEKYNIPEIAKLINKPQSEITKENILQPFEVLDIDTVLISSRHMYRMPYSFNEKSGLVSIPITADQILTFQKPQARPEKVKVTNIKFIERNIPRHQATKLFIEAFDFKLPSKNKQITTKQTFERIEGIVPEDLFPPCIHNIFNGIEDGKKRALFILGNFLSSLNWPKAQITTRIKEWNLKNPSPLPDSYIDGQLNSLNQKNSSVLPPNCQNISYYKDLGICTPDNLCSKIKNPVNYSKRKMFALKRSKEFEAGNAREKLTEEQKAMRRAHRQKVNEMKSKDKVSYI